MSNSEILDQFLKTLKMETSQKYHRALQARPILKILTHSQNWWPWPWPSSSNWPLNFQNISFEPLNWPFCNFAFTHKLFIDHLKVLDKVETSDLDLDLQGQICPLFKCLCISLWMCLLLNHFEFTLQTWTLNHLHHTCLRWIWNWYPWPWPSRSNWPSNFNSLKKLNRFHYSFKLEPFFTTPSNLKCELILY